MMNLNALKIDPEFQGKIPPLTFEELNQLDGLLLGEGQRRDTEGGTLGGGLTIGL